MRSTLTFRGHQIVVTEEALPSRSNDLDPDTTGRLVWECSSLFLKWLSKDEHFAQLCGGGSPPPPFTDAHILDLSSGAGLVPLALSKAGVAKVLSWETASQLRHLQANTAGTPILTSVYYWGEDPAPLLAACSTPTLTCALCSDVLYIALRDGLSRHLSVTLRALTRHLREGGSILFGFEERLIREEGEFMHSLTLPLEPWEGGSGGTAPSGEGLGGVGVAGFAALGAPPLKVLELPVEDTRLTREDTLQRQGGGGAVEGEEGGDGEGEEGAANLDIFWEPPPIRLFLLSALVN